MEINIFEGSVSVPNEACQRNDLAGPSRKRPRSEHQRNLLFSAEFFVDIKNTENGGMTAKCSSCERVIKGKNGISSNFISHLKLKHLALYQKFVSIKKGSVNSTPQKIFEKKLVRMIVECSLPVSIVDQKSFRDLFVGTGLNIIHRKPLMKELHKSYEQMIGRIKKEMSTAKYFCTTADIWSGNHKSFLGYTCHWLDRNFQRHSAALACKRIFVTHSANAKFLEESFNI